MTPAAILRELYSRPDHDELLIILELCADGLWHTVADLGKTLGWHNARITARLDWLSRPWSDTDIWRGELIERASSRYEFTRYRITTLGKAVRALT